MKTARYYKKINDNKIECLLCPHQCQIKEGKSGICGVRITKNNELFTENYGQISSLGIDPIEKKPLYHFYPGSRILSLGTFGCNFKCQFCQNWQISQEKPDLRQLSPEDIIELAQTKDIAGIAYTYSEPSIWFEFVQDTARLARDNHLKNVLVTNGYFKKEPLKELLPDIDAANVDLKAFTNEFYRKLCGGSLQPVLENIELMNQHIHLELTTLIIPGENDSLEELEDLFSWISEMNREIPLHISRYFPNYKFDKKATSPRKMEKVYHLATEYLDYVYLGNVRTDNGSSTICPECGEEVVVRNVYQTSNKLEGDRCPVCDYKISGIFSTS